MAKYKGLSSAIGIFLTAILAGGAAMAKDSSSEDSEPKAKRTILMIESDYADELAAEALSDVFPDPEGVNDAVDDPFDLDRDDNTKFSGKREKIKLRRYSNGQENGYLRYTRIFGDEGQFPVRLGIDYTDGHAGPYDSTKPFDIEATGRIDNPTEIDEFELRLSYVRGQTEYNVTFKNPPDEFDTEIKLKAEHNFGHGIRAELKGKSPAGEWLPEYELEASKDLTVGIFPMRFSGTVELDDEEKVRPTLSWGTIINKPYNIQFGVGVKDFTRSDERQLNFGFSGNFGNVTKEKNHSFVKFELERRERERERRQYYENIVEESLQRAIAQSRSR